MPEQVDPDVQEGALGAGLEQERRGARVRSGVGVAFLDELRQRREESHGRARRAHRHLGRPAIGPRDPLGPDGFLLVGIFRQPPGRDDVVVGLGVLPREGEQLSARGLRRLARSGGPRRGTAANFSLESVSAATISASAAPIAPAVAAAVPPPGVGVSAASGSEEARPAESFEKSVMGGCSRRPGRRERPSPRD